MSLRAIAKEMGVSPAYLSYMVNGKRPWRKDLHEKYTELVNIFVNSHGSQRAGNDAGASFGGSGRESNPPTPLLTRHNGFEVRKSHRALSTPGT